MAHRPSADALRYARTRTARRARQRAWWKLATRLALALATFAGALSGLAVLALASAPHAP